MATLRIARFVGSPFMVTSLQPHLLQPQVAMNGDPTDRAFCRAAIYGDLVANRTDHNRLKQSIATALKLTKSAQSRSRIIALSRRKVTNRS